MERIRKWLEWANRPVTTGEAFAGYAVGLILGFLIGRLA